MTTRPDSRLFIPAATRPREPLHNDCGNRAAAKRLCIQNPRDRRLRFTALFGDHRRRISNQSAIFAPSGIFRNCTMLVNSLRSSSVIAKASRNARYVVD